MQLRQAGFARFNQNRPSALFGLWKAQFCKLFGEQLFEAVSTSQPKTALQGSIPQSFGQSSSSLPLPSSQASSTRL
jgi:hypothetical protein